MISTRDAVVADPSGTLLALDFDGTLAHIVDDPTQAYAHAHSIAALGRLGGVLGQIAIVTGRPVAQALELGGFVGLAGLDRLIILGQYGAERWSASDGDPAPLGRPEAISRLVDLLPQWLAEHGAEDVRVEDKGLAVAIHTRGLDPEVLTALTDPLSTLAADLDLVLEPGRQVMELRAPGADKGEALRSLVEQTGARHVIFAGDDLGDIPAFDAVDDLRSSGLDGLLICSASAEQDALVARADIVLDGPDAVAAWLEELADEF